MYTESFLPAVRLSNKLYCVLTMLYTGTGSRYGFTRVGRHPCFSIRK